MASGSEAHILSIIESSDAGEVLSSISAYLRPFSNLLICREEDRALAIQSTAKQFLPFLAKSLSLLEKRLSVVVTHESPEDLFRAYDFCLECCELVSHDDPDHAVQLHRLGLIHCYRTWGWFTHAYNDSIRVLAQVTGSESRSLRFLPDSGFGDQVNLSRVRVLLQVVASIVGSVAMLPDMDEQHYWTVCSLITQIKPWLRSYLDANAQENFLKRLLSDMRKCALSIIKEAKRFDDKFVVSFCSSMLNHYFISSLPKCYFHKFSRQVLSLLFLSKEIKPSQPFEIVMSLLRTAPREFQVEPEANWLELVGLVSYCAHESQLPGGGWCPGVSKHLSEMAAVFSEAIPQTNVILRLYSAGLSVTVFVVKFSENGQSLGLQALLGDHDIWKSLVSLLGMIDHYPDDQSTTSSDRKKTTQVRCKHNGGVEYTLPYLKALRFVCEPLASLINYERKKIVAEREFACYTGHLFVIQDMFLQFFYGLRFLQRWTPDKECSGRDFDKALRDVVMAAFIISMRTQRKVEITARLVEDVIASPWISPPDLKYLSASFHYIGVSFYNAKNLKKASMAFKLCIRLVWTCVRLLCQMYVVNESNPSEEAAIIDFASEACRKSAFYLDVLQQHGGAREIDKLLVFILENWSAAEEVIKKLPDPTPIVKQWVKIQFLAGSCTPLYSLLSSSQKISNRVTREILEQFLTGAAPVCNGVPTAVTKEEET